MMIAGFAITSGIAGHFLDPFSPLRLVLVGRRRRALLAALARQRSRSWRHRGRHAARRPAAAAAPRPHGVLRDALRQVWAEPRTRRFTLFVFVSMLAYSAQELILEPFAGVVFGFTPGRLGQPVRRAARRACCSA